MGNDGVQPDRRERQGQEGEDGEHSSIYPPSPGALLQQLLERADVDHGEIGVDRLDGPAELVGDALGGNARPGGHDHLALLDVAVGEIDQRVMGALALVVLDDVGDDSDYGEPGLRRGTDEAQALAERVLAGPRRPREGRVDDDRGLPAVPSVSPARGRGSGTDFERVRSSPGSRLLRPHGVTRVRRGPSDSYG